MVASILVDWRRWHHRHGRHWVARERLQHDDPFLFESELRERKKSSITSAGQLWFLHSMASFLFDLQTWRAKFAILLICVCFKHVCLCVSLSTQHSYIFFIKIARPNVWRACARRCCRFSFTFPDTSLLAKTTCSSKLGIFGYAHRG